MEILEKHYVDTNTESKHQTGMTGFVRCVWL